MTLPLNPVSIIVIPPTMLSLRALVSVVRTTALMVSTPSPDRLVSHVSGGGQTDSYESRGLSSSTPGTGFDNNNSNVNPQSSGFNDRSTGGYNDNTSSGDYRTGNTGIDDSPSGGKPSMGERVKGKAEKMFGKTGQQQGVKERGQGQTGGYNKDF